MIEYENECVGCPKDIGCLGSSCPYVNVKHLYCDNCSDEVDYLYEYCDKQICKDCLLETVPKITFDKGSFL
jgi:hypothetical protein